MSLANENDLIIPGTVGTISAAVKAVSYTHLVKIGKKKTIVKIKIKQ